MTTNGLWLKCFKNCYVQVCKIRTVLKISLIILSFFHFNKNNDSGGMILKDIRTNCFCASLLRTQEEEPHQLTKFA